MPADHGKPRAKKAKISSGGSSRSQEEKAEPKDNDTSFSNLLSSTMVNFFVGHKKKHYNIHRALLCSTSPVLKAHFGDVETKHPRNDMYLLQHDLQAFEIFVTFLYRRNFPDITPRTGTPNINGQLGTPADNDGANLDILLNLHLMSCDWLIPDLQNATLDHISRYVTKASIFFRHRQITTIYERIKNPRAPLRRFAVDHFVHSVMKRSVDAKTRQLCLTNRLQIDSSAFLYEVIEAIIGGKRYPMPIDPENKGRCAYHEHPNGVRCQEG